MQKNHTVVLFMDCKAHNVADEAWPEISSVSIIIVTLLEAEMRMATTLLGDVDIFVLSGRRPMSP